MANKIRVLVLAVVLVCIGVFSWTGVILASGTQICKLGSSCVIGEYLYDDNYAPINSNASCSLTTRKPDGSIWLSGTSLSIGSSDGWYSYSVDTSGQSEGYYPSQVCCTIGTGTTEYMCLDKSFQVETAGLTSLGTLPDSINAINSTINTINNNVNAISTSVNSVGTSVNVILGKWGTYSVSDILSSVNSVTNGLGTNSDSCSINSVFGNIACIRDKWGTQTAQALYDMANNALSVGNSLRAEINYNGKSTNAYDDLQTIKGYVDTLETSIGSNGDLSNTSLFGKILGVQTSLASSTSDIRADISDVKTVVDSINGKVDTISGNVTSLLSKWGSYSASDIISNITTVQTRLGTTDDSCSNNTVFGNIACVKDKWGSQTAQTLYDAANGALGLGTSLMTELNYNGKSTTAYDDLQTIKGYVDTLETSIGSSSDLASASTLFGKINGNQSEILGVQTSLSTATSNIRSDIAAIKTVVDSINGKVDTISGNVTSLLGKWGSYSISDILNNIGTVNTALGTNSDNCSVNSIFGNIACVKDKWGSQTAQTLYDAANGALNVGTSLRAELNYNGKSTTAYADLQSIKGYVDTLETSIGNSSDSSSTATLFGKIKNNEEEIVNVPTNVWGYTQRTLTDFGSLVSDIWGYTSRSLTDFGSLIANIWGNQTRTLTAGTLNSGQLANQSDVVGVATSLASSTSDIRADISDVKSTVDSINTNVGSLVTKWGVYSASDILSSVGNITAGLGTNSDNCSVNSVFGNIACVKDKWGSQTADSLYTVANNALSVGNSLRAELNYNGKSITAYDDLQAIKGYVDTLETSIGSSSDLASASTLFGKINGNQSEILGVQTSLASIDDKVDLLSSKVITLNNNVNTLMGKWGTYTVTDVINNIGTIKDSIGVSGDVCGNVNTIFGGIACLQNNDGGNRNNNTILAAIDNTNSLIGSLDNELSYNGKSTTAYADVQAIKSNIGTIIGAIGSSDDSATTATVFGRIKKIQDKVETLDGIGYQATTVIDNWGNLSASDIYNKVEDLSSQISAMNTVPEASTLLTLSQSNSADITALKNELLSIQALVAVNKDLVEKVVDKPIVKTWLEDGSVIFKTMVTNPSASRQTASVKFYLPKEATQKDIIKVDDGVSVNYDASSESLYVSGDFDLAPRETKVISVEITDIWKIADTEIASLKTQSEELSKPLEKTSYYAQSVTLTSDISVLLENIDRTQKEAITPDERIQTYRDNITKLETAKTEINSLKTLVSSLAANNTMTGFIGGAQGFSLWGMALIIVISTVTLTVYFRSLMGKMTNKTKRLKEIIGNQKSMKKIGIVMLLVLGWGGIFGTTYQGLNLVFKSKQAKTAIQKVTNIETAQITETQKVPETQVLGEETKTQIKVMPPTDTNSSLKIRSAPDLNADVLGKIWAKRTVDEYTETDGWVKIGTTLIVDGQEKYITGWIRNQYVEK